MNTNLGFILSLSITLLAIFLPLVCGFGLFVSCKWLSKNQIFKFSLITAIGELVVSSINLVIPVSIDKVNLGFNTNNYLGLDYSFFADPTTKLVAVIVSLVGLVVIAVSGIYFKELQYSARFFGLVLIFVSAMQGLVYSENLLLGFIFWEQMGVVSYLLIGFDSHREKAVLAARKALFYTKFGDAFLLLAIIVLFSKFGQLGIANITTTAADLASDPDMRDTIAISGVFIGFAALVKSAQGFFMGWLLDAMEGPAPVSALLHSATMVAAGVILVGRFSPLWHDMQIVQPVLFIAGLAICTAVLAAVMAIYSDNLKRLLAASTISQISVMYVGLAAGVVSGSWWLLSAHATYKAALFLVVGLITVSLSITSLSSLKSAAVPDKHKWLIVALGIGGFVLSGLPLMSGFYAKESIATAVLEQAINSFAQQTAYRGLAWLLIYLLVMLVALLTAIYSARLIKLALPLRKSMTRTPFVFSSISNLPLILIGLGIVGSFVMALVKYSIWIPSNFVGLVSMLLGLSASIGGFYLGIKVVPINQKKPNIVSQRFYFDYIINRVFIEPLFELSHLCKAFDEKIIDRLGGLICSGYSKITSTLGQFDDKVLDGVVRAVAYIYGALTLLSNFIDRFVIDGFVKQVCASWDRLHKYIKIPQNGQIQAYLLAIMITIVTFALINLPKMVETISEILEVQRKITGGK